MTGRSGAHSGSAADPLPDLLAPLRFLVGTWQGEGVGGYPTITDFRFRQEVAFGWIGGPGLCYSSRSWAVEDGRPLAAEAGFWRPVGGSTVEVLLAHPTGVVEVFYGTLSGSRIELATDLVGRSRTAKQVSAERRLYGMVDGDLAYAVDLAAVGQPLTPHLSARLRRR